MAVELAYSLHLSSDKNKKPSSRKIAKGNPSGTTSQSKNSIQTAHDLSKADKHNLRKYDNDRDKIFILVGSDSLYKDVQDLYLREFEESKIEYNNKLILNGHKERVVENYFDKIANDHSHDLACEVIIELGDKDFWQDKDDEYKKTMSDVYNEQVKDLERLIPAFKVANAVVHLDETSPHMHIMGVPVSENKEITPVVDKALFTVRTSLEHDGKFYPASGTSAYNIVPNNGRPNCVWYVTGRANEVRSEMGKEKVWPYGFDGGWWYEAAVKRDLPCSNNIYDVKPGAIASFRDEDGYGHVIFIEKVKNSQEVNILVVIKKIKDNKKSKNKSNEKIEKEVDSEKEENDEEMEIEENDEEEENEGNFEESEDNEEEEILKEKINKKLKTKQKEINKNNKIESIRKKRKLEEIKKNKKIEKIQANKKQIKKGKK